MIMIKYFLFNVASFCVTVSFSNQFTNINSLNINFVNKSSYPVFLAKSFFTTSLSLIKSTGVAPNFPISNLFIF